MSISHGKRVLFTGAAAVGLLAGAAGIASAATQPSPPAPSASVSVKAAPEPAGDTGVNCENGIDTATRAQCDGGPAAATAADKTEAPDATEAVGSPAATSAETDTVDHQASGQEVGDNGNGVSDATDATETATPERATTGK